MFYLYFSECSVDERNHTWKPQSQSAQLVQHNNARSLFSKERFSHRSHGTTAQHTELLVFLCCSFPQTTLCIHFHLHKSVPCSSSVVSPFQLLLPPAHILARITIPQNTLVNSLGKPEVKSCIRFAQDKTWLLVKCLLVTSPASLLRDG